MANLGDIMQAALPTLLKLSSETLYVALVDSMDTMDDDQVLDETDLEIFHVDHSWSPCSIHDHSPYWAGQSASFANMKLRLVAIKESLGQTYSPKRAVRYRLTKELESPEAFDNVLAQLHRAPKQQEAFLKLSVGQHEELAKYIPQNGIKCADKRGWVEKYWIDSIVWKSPTLLNSQKTLNCLQNNRQRWLPSKAYGKQIAIKPFCYKGSQGVAKQCCTSNSLKTVCAVEAKRFLCCQKLH